MLPKDIEELVKKYPNNYELGEEVRKYYYKDKDRPNITKGILWMGVLFFLVFTLLLTWIVVV